MSINHFFIILIEGFRYKLRKVCRLPAAIFAYSFWKKIKESQLKENSNFWIIFEFKAWILNFWIEFELSFRSFRVV